MRHVGPVVMQLAPPHAHDLDPLEVLGGLEAGGQHDDVGRPLDALRADDAARRDVTDPPGDQLDVVADHRLVEVAADEGALAPERVVGSELGLELVVLDPVVDVAQGDLLQPIGHAVVGTEGDRVLEGPVDLVAVAPRGTSVAGEAALVLFTERLVRARQDPLGRALVHVDLYGDLGHLRDNLCRAGPRADHGDPLPRQVVLVLPAGRVEPRTLEGLEPSDVGHGRRGEGADSAHQHVSLVAVPVCTGQAPESAFFVPAGRRDPNVGAQVRADPETVGAVLEIPENLGLLRVGLRPVGLHGEGVGVQVRRHVARRPRVGVAAPGAAHAVGRLEEHEVAPAQPGQLDG